jgi:predicted dehydrogenase
LSSIPSGPVSIAFRPSRNLSLTPINLELGRRPAKPNLLRRGTPLRRRCGPAVALPRGASGVLHASQILAGEENDFNIRVYGTEASLEWHQENPSDLIVKYPGASKQVHRRGQPHLSEAAARATRLPTGAPEGYIEGFANTYREATRAIYAEVSGEATPQDLDFPTVEDGVKGMAFITGAVQSAKGGGIWTRLPVIS